MAASQATTVRVDEAFEPQVKMSMREGESGTDHESKMAVRGGCGWLRGSKPQGSEEGSHGAGGSNMRGSSICNSPITAKYMQRAVSPPLVGYEEASEKVAASHAHETPAAAAPPLPSPSPPPSPPPPRNGMSVFASVLGFKAGGGHPAPSDHAVHSILSHMQIMNVKPPPVDDVDLKDDVKLKAFHLSEDACSLSKEGKSTFFQATLNCVSLLYGLGILSSPYAVAKAGWMGAIISLIISSTYAFTAYLMAKCVKCHPDCSSYQDIAKLAFGRRIRKLITALFYIEITGTLVGYCISMGDNLNYIFPHTSFSLPGLSNRNFMIFVVSLIMVPSVWLRDLSALSFTSIWCIISTILLLIAVMLAATVNHIGFNHPIPFLRIKGVPVAAGLYAFSYGGTSVFPSICKSMRDPSKFTHVLVLSFFIATASIAGLGVAGAYMFGDNTASQVTLSMPIHFISTKIVLWMTVLTPMFKFALQLSPITTALETQLYRRCKAPKPMLFGMSTLVRSTALAFIAIVSMILPYFEYIVALVGSSMTMAICMVFPCLFYLRLYWDRLKIQSIIFIIVLVIFGMIIGACGTVVAMQGLINSRKSHTS